jgi:uncharacterized protein YgiM (DUF1202 family)
LQGSILSAQNVNLRNGPDTNFDVVVTVQPNTAVEILGQERNTRSQIWYYVRFVGVDNLTYEGWVASRLVDDAGQTVPPLPTPTPEGFSGTAVAFASATPAEAGTPIGSVTPSSQLSDVNILAYCIQDRVIPPRPRADQTVSIWWRWWVTQPDLMQQHLDNVQYMVLLDGQVLSDWRSYRTEMFQDRSNNNRWTVAWYVPVGRLEPGEHVVEYRVSWTAEVFDGLERFGPGTGIPDQTGSCVFTVTE